MRYAIYFRDRLEGWLDARSAGHALALFCDLHRFDGLEEAADEYFGRPGDFTAVAVRQKMN